MEREEMSKEEQEFWEEKRQSYPYRTPTKEELYVGMPVQMQSLDCETCASSFEMYEECFLNREREGCWYDIILDEEWTKIFKDYTGDMRNGPGLPVFGTLRVKREQKPELVPCTCSCHTDDSIIHMVACCHNGMREKEKI